MLTAFATFLALLALLAFQMRSGQDPLLGAGRSAASGTARAPRSVLIRRIVRKRIIIERVEPEDGGETEEGGGTTVVPDTTVAPVSSGGSSSGPVSSATAVSAPAPAPAATTRSS